jgi:hypothetical protein
MSNLTAVRSWREFIARCELIRGPNAGLTRYGLFELAELHRTAGELSEATNVISELLERGKDYGEGDPIDICARERLASILITQRDYDAAEDCLWIALSNSLVVSWTTICSNDKPTVLLPSGVWQTTSKP